MTLAIALSVLIGVALGLLGGGGSILTVPIFVYALGLEPKVAIASSLVVVGTTSLAALVPRIRAREVRWRTGLVFGGAAVVGGYGGGRIAAYIPGEVLLILFAVMMLVTAAAMFKPRAVSELSAPPGTRAPFVILEGLLVGGFTGLVGAGGGFLVVPALVLFGGLPVRTAVGTSLFVIALKSFAAFAGYAGHVSIDWPLVVAITSAAVAGSIVGGLAAGRLAQATLRQVFAWFVVLMALFVIGRELPDAWRASGLFQALFVQRWPFWAGGLAIAAFVTAMLLLSGKPLGVSTGCGELCEVPKRPELRGSWRLSFLFGIPLGGAAAAALGGPAPTLSMGAFDALYPTAWVKITALVVAGVLVGYGARLAGGCTSGHSIVGVAQGARSSIVATIAFMLAGFATTALLVHLGGF